MTEPVLWVDASRGVAGDMLLAALLDAGADSSAMQQAIAAAATAAGESIELRTESVRRHGLRASQVIVTTASSTTRRGLADISAIVAAAALRPTAHRFVDEVFTLLAAAEARVHGIAVESVHFHEVGGLDAVADVVGCAVALDALGLLVPGAVRVVSEVALGGGVARTEHGVLPVPVPAVVELLAGAPVAAGAGDRELCTPTGAALLVALATGWGPLPAMSIASSGVGAGAYDPVDRPNITRVMVGDRAARDLGWQRHDLLMLETTVDDLDPRLWPPVLEAMHEAGAADAWLTPVLMRHGRPGHVLSVLVPADILDAALAVLARLGVTLGARVHAVDRRGLPRDSVTVDVGGQPVAVKRGLLDGRPVSVQPEYRDAVAAAQRTGIALPDVLDQARALARALAPDRLAD